MRPSLPVLSSALLALVAGPAVETSAQCCGTPTVAYSPVVAAPAPAPVVATTTVSEGWYPGKYIANFSRNLFGVNRVNTTYTAGYAPYTAGYAPYTAGYAPSYTVGYAPRYTAGYAPSYQVAYRPTYPASYGPVVQTVSRPVVLSPVVAAPACNTCSTGCDSCGACGGVSQATYLASPSSSCSSCAGGGSIAPPIDSGSSFAEPRPTLAPSDNVPAERSIEVQRPSSDEAFDDNYDYDDSFNDEKTPSDPAAANDYWRAPPLFAPPSNRVTQRHAAPVHAAVYRRPADARATAYRSAAPAKTPRVNRLSADGWASAE